MENLYLNSNLHNIINRDKINDMLNHAYLLISNDRVLANNFADLVACEILCAENAPCFKCTTCVRVKNGTHSDVEKYPQNDKPILTEDVNRIVSECYVLPLEADKKIYILKDFDLATVQAQNKLLKTLEEPPKSVVFVLTTTNESNVLPTIRSRCKKITIPELDEGDLADYLVRSNSIDREKALEIARDSFTVTTALKNINSSNLAIQRELAEYILLRLSSSGEVLKCSYDVMSNVENLEEFLNLLIENISGLMQRNVAGENIGTSIKELVLIAEKVKEAVKKIKSNCNPNAVVDGLLMGILEVKYLCRK